MGDRDCRRHWLPEVPGAFQKKLHDLVMDDADHLERIERIAHQHAQQSDACQRRGAPGNECSQQWLPEHRIEIAGAPFETAAIDGEAEGHIAVLDGCAKATKQRREIGIVALVEDDEAGIDGNIALPVAQGNGPAVAARPRFRIIPMFVAPPTSRAAP